jgi:hypothetical protein
MEAVYNSNFDLIGDVDKAEGRGWFATLVSGEHFEGAFDREPIKEAYFLSKREAIAWLKREHKKLIKAQAA